VALRALDRFGGTAITRTRVSGTLRYMSLRRDDRDARFPDLLDALEADADRPDDADDRSAAEGRRSLSGARPALDRD